MMTEQLVYLSNIFVHGKNENILNSKNNFEDSAVSWSRGYNTSPTGPQGCSPVLLQATDLAIKTSRRKRKRSSD
jgi:hypothetical protein